MILTKTISTNLYLNTYKYEFYFRLLTNKEGNKIDLVKEPVLRFLNDKSYYLVDVEGLAIIYYY